MHSSGAVQGYTHTWNITRWKGQGGGAGCRLPDTGEERPIVRSVVTTLVGWAHHLQGRSAGVWRVSALPLPCPPTHLHGNEKKVKDVAHKQEAHSAQLHQTCTVGGGDSASHDQSTHGGHMTSQHIEV